MPEMNEPKEGDKPVVAPAKADNAPVRPPPVAAPIRQSEGDDLGKFKSVKELKKAYENLEVAYTKKSQEVPAPPVAEEKEPVFTPEGFLKTLTDEAEVEGDDTDSGELTPRRLKSEVAKTIGKAMFPIYSAMAQAQKQQEIETIIRTLDETDIVPFFEDFAKHKAGSLSSVELAKTIKKAINFGMGKRAADSAAREQEKELAMVEGGGGSSRSVTSPSQAGKEMTENEKIAQRILDISKKSKRLPL